MRLVVGTRSVLATEAICACLDAQDGFEVLGGTSEFSSLVDLISTLSPEVALVDVGLIDGSGAAAIHELHHDSEDSKVILLGSRRDDRLAMEALEAGAAGFLTRDQGLVSLVEGIREARSGGPVVDEEVSRRIIGRMAGTTVETGDNLTRREMEALYLMEEGYSAGQMAKKLGISVSTARNHIAKVILKLKVHSMREAVAVARREGIME